EMLDRFGTTKDATVAGSLLFGAQFYASAPAGARRLVRLAEGLVAAKQDPVSLSWLGAALYRADRVPEARKALDESIRLHGKGGYVDTWLFLAMVQQKLGQPEQARQSLQRFENWFKTARLDTWQMKLRFRLLHEEALALLDTMPRVPEGR